MYRIEKVEHKKHRALWLTRLLLDIEPTLYDKVDTIESALANLRVIETKVRESRWVKKRVRFIHANMTFRMLSRTDIPIIDFTIKNIL